MLKRGGPRQRAHGSPLQRSYAKGDNHGDSGGNWAFTDGHAEFFTGSVHSTFFGEPNDDSHTNAQNVNLIDRNRSRRLQTID